MLESKQYRLTKRMRWAARIIGLLAAGGVPNHVDCLRYC